MAPPNIAASTVNMKVVSNILSSSDYLKMNYVMGHFNILLTDVPQFR